MDHWTDWVTFGIACGGLLLAGADFVWGQFRAGRDRKEATRSSASADEKAERALKIAEEAKAAVQVRAALAADQREELHVQILSRQLAGVCKDVGSACEILQSKNSKAQSYARYAARAADNHESFLRWRRLSALYNEAESLLTALETGTMDVDSVRNLYLDLIAEVYDVPEPDAAPTIHVAPSASTTSRASPPPADPAAAAEAP